MIVFPIVSTVSAAFAFVQAKMSRKKILHFYSSIKPVHTVSKIFGLSLFNVRSAPNKQIEADGVGIFNALWFIAIVVANLLLQYFVQTSPRSRANSESILLLSDRFFWAFELFICLTSIISSMVNRKRFISILRNVIDFDNEVTYFQFNIIFYSTFLAIIFFLF